MKQAVRWFCVLLGVFMSSVGFARAATIAAGAEHTVLVTPDGHVWTWGRNYYGQLGLGESIWINHSTPVEVPGLTDVVAVAAGSYHTLALKSDGTVWAWGDNGGGKLGDGTTQNQNMPVQVIGLSNIIAIAAGEIHSLAVGADGTVWGWGYNWYGEVGDGTNVPRPLPTVAPGFSGATAIAAGSWFSLALKADGTVWAAGYQGSGQFGSAPTSGLAPVQMSGITSATGVTGGFDFSLVLLADQTAWAVGSNAWGQLGNGTNGNTFTPGPIPTLSNVTALAAGYRHALGLTADGTVWSWGQNGWGQLGNGSNNDQGIPIAVPGLSDIAAIAAGKSHSVALAADGTVWTWGYNYDGELGNGTTIPSSSPVAISGPNYAWKVPAPSFSVGTGTYSNDQSVTITSVVTGVEIHYTLNGSDPTQSDPTIASGGTVTIDRTRTLKARAWRTGWTASNIASATYTMVVAPVTLSPASGLYAAPFTVSMATTTPSATIYYTKNGTTPTESSVVYDGPLTVTTATVFKAFGVRSGWTPSDVSTSTYEISVGTLDPPIISPSAGTYTSSVTVTLAASTGATIRYTTDGTTPSESSFAYAGPFVVTTTSTVRARAFLSQYFPSPVASATYTIVVADPTITPPSGTYAADQAIIVISATPGADVHYTLDGTDPTQTGPVISASDHLTAGTYTLKARAWKTGCSPSAIVSATFATTGVFTTPAISAGFGDSFALRSDGQLWSWGNNIYLEMGDGSSTSRYTPQLVPGLTGVRQMIAGAAHNFALLSDGSLRVWGENSDGRLGIGNNIPQSRPVPVPGLTNVVAMDGGSTHSVVLLADGTVVTWGANWSGQLGNGGYTSYNTPGPVPGLTNMTAVKAGNVHSLALRSDGTLWSWGMNSSGQLGNGTQNTGLTPTQVTGLSNVRAMDGGYLSSVALLNDGTVWTWGDNGYGQLGASTPSRLTAAVVPTLSYVTQVAAGDYHVVVLRADGTVWTWGRNLEGELGDGSTNGRAIPAQVAGLTDIVAVAAGEYHSMALAADGTVWVWGRNYNGTIGDGSTQNALLPVAITLSNLTVRVPAPVIAPGSGTFASAQSVTITSAMPGTTIHYTLNASDPTGLSPTYTGPLSVTTRTVITARAFQPGLIPSLPTAALLTFDYGTLATPTASPAGGNFQASVNVTISGPASATVHYTTDGSDPGENAAVYTGPLTFSSTTTLKARAFRADWTPSAVMTEAYVNPCVFTVAPGAVTAGSHAGGGVLTITAGDPGCAWNATSTVPWITLGAAGGSGAAQVPYTIAANPNAAARQGVISIAGQTIVVSQGGAACTYSLTPGGVAATANATVGTIAVTPSDPSCTWSTASDASWLTFQVGAQTSAYAQSVLADHPIAYWRLDATPSATTIADASGGAHAGAVSGAVTFGQPGAIADGATAAGFDGTTAAIAIPHDPAFVLPALSWEAWINVPQVSDHARRVLGKGAANETFALWLNANTTQPTIVWTTVGGGRQSVTLNANVIGAGWIHVAFTDDGVTWRAFVNGVEDHAGTLADTLVSNSESLIFGREDATPATAWYDGQLQDVALYPYALSAEQIANHYALRTAVWGGTGQLEYALAENQTGAARSAILTIAGSPVPVNQGATGDLIVTGYVTPTPNSQGWSKTDVTVSFVCAGPGTVTCPAPVPITTEGVQEITGTATDDSGQSATATVTVQVDKAAPALSITLPVTGAVIASGTFVVVGMAYDLVSPVSVTCDGQAATMAGGTFFCESTISSGSKTILVQATDAASNGRTATVTVQASNSLTIEPTELRITPQQVTMVVGQTRTFSVRDNLGRIPSDAVWTVDAPTVAGIATIPTVMLTAQAAGEVTLTAAWHSLTATTHITVVSAASTTVGTVLWVAPPVLTSVSQIVQGMAPDGTNCSYVVEKGGPDDSDLIRAFTVDGSELWSASANGHVGQLTSIARGGVIAEITTNEGISRLRSFDVNGGAADLATSNHSGFAVHPVGPLYHVEPQGDLVGVDIGAGGGTRVQLPRSEMRTCTGGNFENPQGCTSSWFFENAGTPTVLWSGTVVVPVVTGHYTVINGQSEQIKDTRTISAFFLKPDGQTTVTPVASFWGLVSMGAFKAVPNGAGGVLVAWNEMGYTWYGDLGAMVAAVRADGTTSGIALIGKWWGDLALGEGNDILAITLNGPPGGPYKRRLLTHLNADAGIGQFDILDHNEVSSVVGAHGGGFVVNYADGTMTGPSADYAQMNLKMAQYVDNGVWVGVGAGAAGAGQQSGSQAQAADVAAASGGLLSAIGPSFQLAMTDWPWSWGNLFGSNAPPPRDVDTARLWVIAKAEHVVTGDRSLANNRTVGRAFQQFCLDTFGLQENTTSFFSQVRLELNLAVGRSLPASVIPDAVTDAGLIKVGGDSLVKLVWYKKSTIIEVKAVEGIMDETYSKFQLMGMIDMANQSEAGQNHTSQSPLPTLTFATTSDTEIGPDVRLAATTSRVLLRQVKLQEVSEMQLQLGWLHVVNQEVALRVPTPRGSFYGAFSSPLPAFPARRLTYPRNLRTILDPDPTELQDQP